MRLRLDGQESGTVTGVDEPVSGEVQGGHVGVSTPRTTGKRKAFSVVKDLAARLRRDIEEEMPFTRGHSPTLSVGSGLPRRNDGDE